MKELDLTFLSYPCYEKQRHQLQIGPMPLYKQMLEEDTAISLAAESASVGSRRQTKEGAPSISPLRVIYAANDSSDDADNTPHEYLTAVRQPIGPSSPKARERRLQQADADATQCVGMKSIFPEACSIPSASTSVETVRGPVADGSPPESFTNINLKAVASSKFNSRAPSIAAFYPLVTAATPSSKDAQPETSTRRNRESGCEQCMANLQQDFDLILQPAA
jgi:hypothetical protein